MKNGRKKNSKINTSILLKFISIFSFAITIFVVPIAGFWIGTYYPNGKFETAVISLLIGIFSTTAIIYFHVYFHSFKSDENANGIIENLADAIEESTSQIHHHVHLFKIIKNEDAKNHISKMIELHNKIAHNHNGFANASDYVSKYFIHVYMASYVDALNKAANDRTIHLKSGPRMEVAILALGNANQIFSMNTNADRWFNRGGDDYQEANLNAAHKGTKIKRIFIFESQEDLKKHEHIIRAQYEAGIDIQTALEPKLREQLNKDKSLITIINMLIWDMEGMTYSSADDKLHDGYLSMSQPVILNHYNDFMLVWRNYSSKYIPSTERRKN